MAYKVFLFISIIVGVSCDVLNGNSSCQAIYSCLDCSTARLCRPDGKGGFEQIETIACPEKSPFCNYATGTCSPVSDDRCGEKDSFTCLSDGYYPDNDCKVYHVCHGNIATKFHCYDEVYNADEEKCDSRTYMCGEMRCDTGGKKVRHSYFPTYFAYCKSANKTAVIDRCPGNYYLNETSQSCQPICDSEGVMQDMDDCTKFFKCQYTIMISAEWMDPYGRNKIMLISHHDCPKGSGFDPSNYMCVPLPSPSLPNCKPK